MGEFKEAVRRVASRLVVGSGLSRASRRLFPKQGAMIFYGHRVSADDEGYLQGLKPEWLDAQLAYLTRHYEIIPLAKLIRCYEERRPVPTRSAVITFDDGFRDNLENAFPILRRHGVTATIFLVTGSVTEGSLPWPQRLGYLFQQTQQDELHHPFLGASPMALTDASLRWRTSQKMKEALKPLDRHARETVLDELSTLLEVEPPRNRMLTWDQAREMQAAEITFGAHTYSHPLLAEVSESEARIEIDHSRNDLREQLGIERPPFAFPGGSFTPALVELVRSMGFSSAFQSRPEVRVNQIDQNDKFSLSRVGFHSAPAFVLEAELEGPFHAIRGWYRR